LQRVVPPVPERAAGPGLHRSHRPPRFRSLPQALRGEPDDLGAGIGRIGGAGHHTLLLEFVDHRHLALLGDQGAVRAPPEAPPLPASDWRESGAMLRDVRSRAAKTIVLGAFDDGVPIGTATIEMDDVLGDDDEALPGGTAILRMLGVAPDARGRGAGRALVRETIDRARRAGKHTLLLRTTPLMQVAQAMYRSMGFERDTS